MAWPPKLPKLPDFLTELFETIIARIDAGWPVDGIGSKVSDAAGGKAGRSINVFGGTSGAGVASVAGPWAIINGTEEGTVKVGPNSTLLGDLGLNSQQPIIGIDDDMELTEGQVIYLHMTHDGTGGVTSASLVANDRWAEYPNVFKVTGAGTMIDPYIVSESFFLIGEALDPEDAEGLEGPTIAIDEETSLKIVRCCFTPLVLRFENTGAGFIVNYPSPGTRGGSV